MVDEPGIHGTFTILNRSDTRYTSENQIKILYECKLYQETKSTFYFPSASRFRQELFIELVPLENQTKRI